MFSLYVEVTDSKENNSKIMLFFICLCDYIYF